MNRPNYMNEHYIVDNINIDLIYDMRSLKQEENSIRIKFNKKEIDYNFTLRDYNNLENLLKEITEKKRNAVRKKRLYSLYYFLRNLNFDTYHLFFNNSLKSISILDQVDFVHFYIYMGNENKIYVILDKMMNYNHRRFNNNNKKNKTFSDAFIRKYESVKYIEQLVKDSNKFLNKIENAKKDN